MPRSMKVGTFECEKCHAIAEVRIETVDGRGPGFKCAVCAWWTWLPEDEGVRGQLSWMAQMDLLAQEVARRSAALGGHRGSRAPVTPPTKFQGSEGRGNQEHLSSAKAAVPPDPETPPTKFRGEPIDPVCLFHGKRLSEHHCLYCCLCFRTLTVDECHQRADGTREDVCNECAAFEAIAR